MCAVHRSSIFDWPFAFCLSSILIIIMVVMSFGSELRTAAATTANDDADDHGFDDHDLELERLHGTSARLLSLFAFCVPVSRCEWSSF